MFVFDFLQLIMNLVFAKNYSRFLTLGEHRCGEHQKNDGENEHVCVYSCSWSVQK